MTYHNAIKYIKNAPEGNEKKPSFERIKLLCESLGNPQRRLRYIRLAGSNGKTVCAEMLMSVLNASGHRVGCLYMPARDDIRENIRVGAGIISIEDTARYMTVIYEAVCAIRKAQTELFLKQHEDAAERDLKLLEASLFTPTSSELLLALALLVFKENNCSLCIIEGNHNGPDPSKFLPPPFAAMICGTIPNVDKNEITRIRSYICRGIQEIVSSPQNKEAYRLISDTCASVNCRLTIPSKASVKNITSNLGGTRFSYKSAPYSLRLCGSFQISNATLVLEAIEMLKRRGIRIGDDAVHDGLASLTIKSKFEVISLCPAIIADSTHKHEAIETVCGSLEELSGFIGKRIRLCLQPHIIEDYIKTLTKKSYDITKIVTLGTSSESVPEALICKTPKACAKEALKALEQNEILLISGNYDFTDKVRTELLALLG